VVHGGHSHAITSELFPPSVSPHSFLAAGGPPWVLYLLPAAGFLLTLAGCGWIGVAARSAPAAPQALRRFTARWATHRCCFYGPGVLGAHAGGPAWRRWQQHGFVTRRLMAATRAEPWAGLAFGESAILLRPRRPRGSHLAGSGVRGNPACRRGPPLLAAFAKAGGGVQRCLSRRFGVYGLAHFGPV